MNKSTDYDDDDDDEVEIRQYKVLVVNYVRYVYDRYRWYCWETAQLARPQLPTDLLKTSLLKCINKLSGWTFL